MPNLNYVIEIGSSLKKSAKKTLFLKARAQMYLFKSNENIQKKEDGPDRSVSNNIFSFVTLNELTMKARERILKYRISRSQSNLD